jgi:integrase/recombinase XerD
MSFQNDIWEAKSEVVLRSWQTKGSKAQTVILNSQLRAELEQYVRQYCPPNTKNEDILLQSQKGSGFSSQTIQNLFRTLYEAAGLQNASSHSGRRTFITGLSEKGVSVRVIQELARHSSMNTTQRYIDVSVDKLRIAAEVIVTSRI